MNEFTRKGWLGSIIFFNINDNLTSDWRIASACLTNGCTNHINSLNSKMRTSGTAIYDLFLPRDLSYTKHGAFWCPFTLGQVITTLEDINKVISFKFIIEETADFFKIRLEISKEKYCCREHFYILTRVRYLYEYPQCVLYKDAMELLEMDEFKKYSLQNLYNLVVSSCPIIRSDNSHSLSRSYWYDPYHSIPLNQETNIPKFLTDNELKDRLSTVRYGTLNGIYPPCGNKNPIKFPEDYFKLMESLVFWREPEGFKMRLPYYLANLKLYEQEGLKKAKISDLPDFSKEIEILKEKDLQVKEELKNTKFDYNKIYSDRSNYYLNNNRSKSRYFDKTLWGPNTVEPVYSFNLLHPRDSKGRFIKRVTIKEI